MPEAIAAMQDECAEHIRVAPSEPTCARGMAKLFMYLHDTPDARRWMAFYLERKVEPDPEAERQYQTDAGRKVSAWQSAGCAVSFSCDTSPLRS